MAGMATQLTKTVQRTGAADDKDLQPLARAIQRPSIEGNFTPLL